MRVYFDNAATTQPDPQVIEAMLPFLETHFGNPSSTHAHGREVKTALEKARRTIAGLMGVAPAEIVFTSGGTESDNMAICGYVCGHGVKHAVTSRLEHHAVLHTLERLAEKGETRLSFVEHDGKGRLDLDHLEHLLKANPRSFVSIMHGNNEIGNINPVETIGGLCAEHGCYFHSDTVQTAGHFPLLPKAIKAHAVVGAAHKFHGPKGAGFLYLDKDAKVPPFINGGSQERNMRGGTENITGIIGMAKAFELAVTQAVEHKAKISAVKARMVAKLREAFPDVKFNGLSGNMDESLYTVLNVSLPPNPSGSLLLFNLDMQQVSASGGSACSSGANTGSHVLNALGTAEGRVNIRFSFSRFNTPAEADHVVGVLQGLYQGLTAQAG